MSIIIQKVSKSFNNRDGKVNSIHILKNISFTIPDGEIVSVFGPNGCGKTTLLNLIAGLEKPSNGSISTENNLKKTKTGYVFQNYQDSCFPWRNVFGNIEFGLEVQKVSKKQRIKTVNALLKTAGLWSHRDKYLYQLSGGLKQLTAICQTIVFNPDILLLDEPFSSLDYSVCKKMEMVFLKLLEHKPKTTLFVSHDIDEAIFLADRVIVLSKRPTIIKNIIRVSLPRPRNLEMIGSHKFNLIRTELLKSFDYDTSI